MLWLPAPLKRVAEAACTRWASCTASSDLVLLGSRSSIEGRVSLLLLCLIDDDRWHELAVVNLQTYTTLGTPGNVGLIPRAVEQLFTSATSLESSHGWTFQMKVYSSSHVYLVSPQQLMLAFQRMPLRPRFSSSAWCDDLCPNPFHFSGWLLVG